MIPSNITLETQLVRLRPVQESDYDRFLELAQDEEMWKYYPLNLANPDHLKQFMNTNFREMQMNTRRAFAIIEKASGKVAGTMSFLNISPHDLRLEIGSSWLGKEFRGTNVNFHSKYSMLKFAFEELNFERVEFKTDVLNERAKQGLRKIGGIEEGVLRSHMTMWNNRRRDSVYFSILKNEWPALKQTIFRDIEA